MIKVTKGTAAHVETCIRILQNSILSEIYFTTEDYVRNFLHEAMERDELSIAQNDADDIVGFMRIAVNGAFSNFPFLHLIAVDERYRGKGYGSAMLGYFEGLFRNHKLFLLVCEHNSNAHALYIKNGYVQVGVIPDLYIKGVNEHLMMKVVE